MSLFASRMLGGAYWASVQSFFAPIFVANIDPQEKTGFFQNLSIPQILKDLPPVSKFANTTFLVVGIGGAGHDGGNLTDKGIALQGLFFVIAYIVVDMLGRSNIL